MDYKEDKFSSQFVFKNQMKLGDVGARGLLNIISKLIKLNEKSCQYMNFWIHKLSNGNNLALSTIFTFNPFSEKEILTNNRLNQPFYEYLNLFYNYGNKGVDFFFIISGFVLLCLSLKQK